VRYLASVAGASLSDCNTIWQHSKSAVLGIIPLLSAYPPELVKEALWLLCNLSIIAEAVDAFVKLDQLIHALINTVLEQPLSRSVVRTA
jgi:hypothetical protein